MSNQNKEVNYEEATIEDLVDNITSNKDNKRGNLFLIGIGVSESTGIPVAKDIVEKIKEKYHESSKRCKGNSYSEYMRVLTHD